MSSSEDKADRANDEYGWIDRYAADLHRSAKELVAKGEAARVSDEAVAQLITAAVRLYYAKSELEDRPVPAVVQEGEETLTPTEMLVAVSEMLRDVRTRPNGAWTVVPAPARREPPGRKRQQSLRTRCEEQTINQPIVGIPQMLPAQVIDTSTDSREILRHARNAAMRRKLQDWFIVDVDAHHVETVSWSEVVQYIEDPVIRDQALHFHKDRLGAPPYGLNGDLGLRYQSVGGRIPHQDGLREKIEDVSVHRDVTLTRRAMDSLGVDNMVVFPTPMLFLGLHPQPEMEVWLSRAYNKWMQENLLSADSRIKFLAVLPYNTPEEAERVVKETAGKNGIIGYAIPSTRHAPVHHNKYMRLYRMIEETGMPLSFHTGYHWDDPSLKTINRFLGMHALGFAWPNIVHCTNWVLNGMPVRFPKLKVIWIESRD